MGFTRGIMQVLSAFVLAVLASGSAHAVSESVIISGVATSDGALDVILEDTKGPLAAVYVISVGVMAGDNEIVTRDSLFAASQEVLPPSIKVSLGPSCVAYTGEITGIEIVEDVDGQEYIQQAGLCPEPPIRNAPAASPWTWSIAALLVGSLGAVMLRRRVLTP
jgi:hypothetical protein